MLKSKKFLFLSLVTSSLLFAEETTKLDEITVSANKMEENIQDVPQSISVITEEDIEQKGIRKIDDIIKEVPNMFIQNDISGKKTSFRGLTNSTFTNTNPVVIYLDGIPYYDRYDYNPSLVDVEQVEVLRGPQGTLYGKDAIGAVINIVTKSPKNEWSGTIGAEYGNDNTFDTKLNTNGAIIDNKLFAGINGSFYHTDGWITNHYSGMKDDANEKNDRKTSGFLLYKPTDNLSAKLTVSDNFSKSNFFDGFNIQDLSRLNSVKRDEAKNVSFDVPTFTKSKVKAQALNLSYELEKVKLESVTTHKKMKLDGDYDIDSLSNQVVNNGLKQFNWQNGDTWTQELKLSSKNQDIKWVTGLYFDKEKREINPYGYEDDSMGGLYKQNSASTTNSETYSAFGQVMIPLGNSFDLTLGGRYQKIKKDTNVLVTDKFDGSLINSMPYLDEKTWNTFLPKVALSYKINDNLTTYVSVSKGYMPGEFNYFPYSSGSKENTFEPSTSINYEIGAKYIGDNFAINTAIFKMNIEDKHVYKRINGMTHTSNAKRAHSQGVELDGTYFLTDNWSISGAVGLVQAKYDDYDSGDRTYNGEKIQDTPKYTANLGISYLADSGIYGRVDFNAVGKTSFFVDDSLYEVDGGITTNTKIGYKIGTFDIYGFVKNITDEDYITSIYAPNLVSFNESRRFGIGAIYKF
ncbi:TonB-dependent receptor [Aliarcobacter butzleri]|uniref:TonB-dependent receptor n=1 Tax=Aliarcobacter butzleri TaxID=28197 RepID=UPI00125FC1E4|nr:TonB-dependent receptor [Aliarcobacter butzleri]